MMTNNWKPFPGRCPRKNGWYLITILNEHLQPKVTIAHWARKHWTTIEEREVLAWMSLPEPASKWEFDQDDFEEVEGLKLGEWYPREMFDGNPYGWLILEQSYYGSYKSVDFELGFLFDDTTRFMYVKHPELNDED